MKSCLEYHAIGLFFEEEHLITKRQEGEERIKFLKPPSWYCGGRVPGRALYREDNIALLKIDMIPAVDITYAALGKVNKLAKTKYDEHVGIRLIPKVLHACERRGIPQNFVPGMLLLYLEHCENCPWRHLVPEILVRKYEVLNLLEELRKEGKEAKLDPEDWPEYMATAVADFVRATRRIRC
jgi:hypothetical protein